MLFILLLIFDLSLFNLIIYYFTLILAYYFNSLLFNDKYLSK